MARIILLAICILCTGLFADYVPNQVIVTFKKPLQVFSTGIPQSIPQSTQTLLKKHGAFTTKALSRIDNSPTVFSTRAKRIVPDENNLLITYATTMDIPTVIATLSADSNVKHVQPNYIYKCLASPNDPASINQTYLNLIHAAQAWDICTGNASVIVAVIDSGMLTTHLDFTTPSSIRILTGRNTVAVPNNNNVTDGFGHGTRVTGIIAANTDNGEGISGIDWNCQILPIKAMDDSGDGTTVTIRDGIAYAIANGASIINMSLGGTGDDPALYTACHEAYYDYDIILVAAMGNYPQTTPRNAVVYPAGYDSVIGVGSVSNTLILSSFSIYGAGNQTTELVAPGEATYTTTLTGYNGAESGTSFSSPMVAGVAALLRAKYPTLKNTQIRDILHYSSIDLGTVGYDTYYGYGLVNAENALNRASTLVSNKSISAIYNFPNPVRGGKTRFSFRSEKSIQSSEFIIYDLRGRMLATLTAGGSIFTNGGIYKTGEWDCRDSNGSLLPNGTYIYTIKAIDVNGGEHTAKGKMSIVR